VVGCSLYKVKVRSRSEISDVKAVYIVLNPYILELNDKFLGKKLNNLLKTGPNFFFSISTIRILNFVKFVDSKKGVTTNFFPSLFC
jgi:hypothetical protein